MISDTMRSSGRLTTAKAAVARHRRTLRYRMWRGKAGYLMVVPTLVLLAVFQYYPAISGLYRSFFDWTVGLEGEFIGLANFVELFARDGRFVGSLRNMSIMAVWYLLTSVALSLAVAVLLHRLRSERLQYIFRILMILPVIIPGVVFILLWVFIYDATVGPLNASLAALGLAHWTRAWLADPKITLYAVTLRNFPWIDGVFVLIILAGLQTVPIEIIECGRLDGAEGIKRLWHIELPLIGGQIALIAVLTIMWSVQEYSAVWAMTQGGPIYSSMVPGMLMYWNAFTLGRMGYASAIGVVMFLITLIATIINMRYIRAQGI